MKTADVPNSAMLYRALDRLRVSAMVSRGWSTDDHHLPGGETNSFSLVIDCLDALAERIVHPLDEDLNIVIVVLAPAVRDVVDALYRADAERLVQSDIDESENSETPLVKWEG